MAGHLHAGAGKRLRLALLLTLGVLALEVVGGLWAHSLALLADAGHVAADVLALALSWFAVVQARRPADPRRSYGYHRAAILAALANAGALLVVVGVIAGEAVGRLLHPVPVAGGAVVVTAVAAIAVNGVAGWLLHRGTADLNVRAAFLHVAGDLAAAAGVVGAGLVILATGRLEADPVVSLAISGLVAWGALRVGWEAVHVLLEGTPRGVDLAEVEALLRGGAGVQSVHDLHVWSVASEHAALSAHLVVGELSVVEGEHLVRELEGRLCDGFGIGHTTIQLESCHPCEAAGEHLPGEHNHPHPEPARTL